MGSIGTQIISDHGGFFLLSEGHYVGLAGKLDSMLIVVFLISDCSAKFGAEIVSRIDSSLQKGERVQCT